MTREGQVRRVTTGHDAVGAPTFLGDTSGAPICPPTGADWYSLAGQDGPLFAGDGCSTVPESAFYPAPGGVRFGILVLPPDPAAAQAAPATLTPTSDAGMHQTQTCDFAVVVSGFIRLELGSGVDATL